ncbi:MAG TPA: Zn-ribbon domain-containing OB-fold protein [Solirubrobacteraceae bacterium]|nr:Zn-ribbon domain-containing OB-fold protein [Solirubrobacteraceae bacterium]
MSKPLPEVQPWTQPFWDGTREGKLLVQVCHQCQARIFLPRKLCPECWSSDLGWIESAGTGTVFTFSTAYQMVEPRFMDELPYTIAFVDLAEGVRMMTRIVGCDPAEIAIGMEVEVVFNERGDFRLPYFRPASHAGRDE